jgi:uncharacterized cupin superfamily protein
MAMYHHEAGQEDFLVLRGECVLVIEGHERALHAWDFVQCPPRTPHTIIGGGLGPSLVLAVGARQERGTVRYVVGEAAIKHDAGLAAESSSAEEAYARFSEARRGPLPEIF